MIGKLRRRWRDRREAAISRTWWRQNSDGTFFRNCPAVEMDRERLENKLPWRYKALTDEWWAIFREGVISRETIPKGDRWIAFDDSREATGAWCNRLLVEHGFDPQFPSAW